MDRKRKINLSGSDAALRLRFVLEDYAFFLSVCFARLTTAQKSQRHLSLEL
jgi:hypothetical protein